MNVFQLKSALLEKLEEEHSRDDGFFADFNKVNMPCWNYLRKWNPGKKSWGIWKKWAIVFKLFCRKNLLNMRQIKTE